MDGMRGEGQEEGSSPCVEPHQVRGSVGGAVLSALVWGNQWGPQRRSRLIWEIPPSEGPLCAKHDAGAARSGGACS